MAPGFVFILGALVLPFLPKLLRRIWVPALAVMALLAVANLAPGQVATGRFWGQDLGLLQVDSIRILFGIAFALSTLIWGVYAWDNDDRVERTAGLLYAGAALVVVFAGDWLLLFLGWEVMSLSSAVIILAARRPEAYRAALGYLLVHVTGGVLVLAGISLIQASTGSTTVGPVALDGLGPWLLFSGVAINAAVWPFQFWVPDAYPEATPTGTVLLGTYTTKTAAFVMIIVFAGAPILMALGAIMALYGVVYALSTRNYRRLLAYSLVGQVGFVLMAAGVGPAAGPDGFSLGQSAAAAHAFMHVLYKSLLFMSAGAVLLRTGRPEGGGFAGLWRQMPWAFGFGVIGAITICAFPLTGAFASKNLISAALHDGSSRLAETATTVLYLVGALSPLYVGLRWLWLTFSGRDEGVEVAPSPVPMRLAMGVVAVLCVAAGLLAPQWVGLLPGTEGVTIISWGQVGKQLGLLAVGVLLFLAWRSAARKSLYGRLAGLPDTDRLARRLVMGFVAWIEGPFERTMARVSGFFHEAVPEQLGFMAQNPGGFMRVAVERIRLGGTALFGSQAAIDRAQARFTTQLRTYRHTPAGAGWPIGQTVLFAAVILAVALLIWLVG